MQTYTPHWECFNFHQKKKKKCFSYHFDILFWISIKFSQQNINQSETQVGDKNLSVELYVNKVH